MAQRAAWFAAGNSEWWVDEYAPDSAPTADTRVDEVRCTDVHEALQLITRLLDTAQGIDASRVFDLVRWPHARSGVPMDDRYYHIAQLIASRRLRVWERTRVTLTAGRGGGTGSAADPQWAKPEPRTYTRPALRRTPIVPPPIILPTDLVWYEFVLLDELGDGLPNVDVQMSTPKGSAKLRTSGSGSVRVEQAPKGEGSATIDAASLAAALENRSERARRKSKLPDKNVRFDIVTPSRANGTFTFPHQDPHRVMIVSRTDIVVTGSDRGWRELTASDASKPLCLFTPGEQDLLHLCSRGSGESANVSGDVAANETELNDSAAPAQRASETKGVYKVKAGDTLWGIAGHLWGNVLRWPEIRDANPALFASRSPNLILVGDVLNIPVEPALQFFADVGEWPEPDIAATLPPPFIDVDVDPLHEALFDLQGDTKFDSVTGPLVQLPPPDEPFFGSPQPAADAAAVVAGVVALERGVTVDTLFEPLTLPLFDPVERAGPPKPNDDVAGN